MNKASRFSRAIGFLRSLTDRKNTDKRPVNEELVNSRLGINTSEANTSKKAGSAIQLLMYSKENNTLFI